MPDIINQELTVKQRVDLDEKNILEKHWAWKWHLSQQKQLHLKKTTSITAGQKSDSKHFSKYLIEKHIFIIYMALCEAKLKQFY